MGLHCRCSYRNQKRDVQRQQTQQQQSERDFSLSVFRGSVADQRKVGLGHGNLGKMLLEEDTECFAFLAGHESFAAAEGAIGIAEKANKVRKKPLRVILNGLGKDAAQIIARINGFTYVETELDYHTGELKEVFRKAYSDGASCKRLTDYGAERRSRRC